MNIQASEISAILKRGTAEEIGLKLRRSADGKKAVSISFDGKTLRVAGLDVPVSLKPSDDSVGLHIFLDHSVLELYADGAACITRVLDAAPDDQHPRSQAVTQWAEAHPRKAANQPRASRPPRVPS